MLKRNVEPVFLTVLMWLLAICPLGAELSWDSERLNLETSMQKRVEEALSKILSPGQFVVVIHIEPLPQAINPSQKSGNSNEIFYLPGVPARKNYDAAVENLVEAIKSDSQAFRRFIRKISVTLVVDQTLSNDEVKKIRDLTRQMLGLDKERGDTLDVQRSAFHRPGESLNESTILRVQKNLTNYWLLISLALILFCITVFSLFMFGPLRGFLNRFVQVLPTLRPVEPPPSLSRMGGDMQALPSLLSQVYGLPAPSAGGVSPASFSGSLQVESPNKTTLPFGFIRENHLGNLAILLSRETPEKAAVVLGYLPPEWISRVLSKLDQSMQSEVATHLATTRQLLPEQVEDIEQDLKRRLDYLIGGPDRIIAVYESLDPEGQKRMLESLRESRPELAEELRQRTLLFEDLEKLESPALKAVLRETDLQTIVSSLKGLSESFKNRILEHVSAGKAEIIREELDLSDSPGGRATAEAQRRMVNIARRLEKEGQINIPQVEGPAPSTRYGSALQSTMKLPSAINVDETVIDSGPAVQEGAGSGNIEERIRQFMNRTAGDRERYPTGDKKDSGEPPQAA